VRGEQEPWPGSRPIIHTWPQTLAQVSHRGAPILTHKPLNLIRLVPLLPKRLTPPFHLTFNIARDNPERFVSGLALQEHDARPINLHAIEPRHSRLTQPGRKSLLRGTQTGSDG
jgi:hypothetical protein